MASTPLRSSYATLLSSFPPLSAVAHVDEKHGLQQPLLNDSFDSGDHSGLDLDVSAVSHSFSDDDTSCVLQKRFQQLETNDSSVTATLTPSTGHDSGSSAVRAGTSFEGNGGAGRGGFFLTPQEPSRLLSAPFSEAPPPSSPPSRAMQYMGSPSMTPISLRPAPDQVCVV